MTKNSPAPTASTELMNPGQTSDALRVKLRAIGSRITDEQISTAWRDAEKHRVSFSCAATALGVLLLAKKESQGHGKWLPWCEKFGAKLAAEVKGQIGSALPIWKEVAPRTLREYSHIGEHFLSDLEQSDFTGEITDHKPKLEGVTPDDVLHLDTLSGASRKKVFGRIEEFVAGRSLRTMLTDFRRAESAADQEQAEHEAELARKKAKKTGKDSAGEKVDPRQLEFREMFAPLGVIDTLFETKSFVEKTDREFWLGVAQKLEAQAERARKMAEEVAS